MKMFTCTNLAVSHGAMGNKLFVVTAETEVLGRTRYTCMNLDITAHGVQPAKIRNLLTDHVLDAKALNPAGSLVLIQNEALAMCFKLENRKIEIELSAFFEEITLQQIRDVQLRLNKERLQYELEQDMLSLSEVVRDDKETRTLLKHEGAMRRFKYIEESNDRDARDAIQELSAEDKAGIARAVALEEANERAAEIKTVIDMVQSFQDAASIVEADAAIQAAKDAEAKAAYDASILEEAKSLVRELEEEAEQLESDALALAVQAEDLAYETDRVHDALEIARTRVEIARVKALKNQSR